jgi:hypothetical protein
MDVQFNHAALARTRDDARIKRIEHFGENGQDVNPQAGTPL